MNNTKNINRNLQMIMNDQEKEYLDIYIYIYIHIFHNLNRHKLAGRDNESLIFDLFSKQ